MYERCKKDLSCVTFFFFCFFSTLFIFPSLSSIAPLFLFLSHFPHFLLLWTKVFINPTKKVSDRRSPKFPVFLNNVRWDIIFYSRRCAATSVSLSCSYFVPFVRSSSFSSTNARKWIDPFVHGQCAPSYTRTKPPSLIELGKISIDHSFLYHFLLWPCIFRGLQGFPLFPFISHSTFCSSRGSVFDGSSATSTRRFEIDLVKWNVTRELAGRASRRPTYASHQPRNCLTTMR